MPLTEAQKEANARAREIEKFRELQIGTCVGRVAKVFQLMVRAEWGRRDGYVECVKPGGQLHYVFSVFGNVACVTCGKVGPWKGGSHAPGGGMHTGHFVRSRRPSVVFEETNVAPQCYHCNIQLDGNEGAYEQYMLHVYGQAEIDRLRALKTQTRQFTREELVDLRRGYKRRLKAAEEAMQQ